MVLSDCHRGGTMALVFARRCFNVWLCACLCIGTTSLCAEVGDADPIVIVLSWDGLRHDFPDRGAFPGLRRLQTEGVRAGRLTPVYPSSTFPGHVSMATGTFPDKHGIVGNHFLDRVCGVYSYAADANWIEAEPLWIAAERQGVPAATYFWVGSESDWHGQGTRYRISPFDGQRAEALKVDQILSWLLLTEAERPRLIMSYWAGADSVAHRYGPDDQRVARQIARQDRQLQRLLEGLDSLQLWDRATLLLVSDHGMTTVGANLDVPGALADAGIGARVFGASVGHVFLDDIAQLARAREVLGNLDPLSIYTPEEIPPSWRLRHPTRTGDLLLTTVPPYSLSGAAGFEGLMVSALSTAGWAFGSHGYDPALKDMGGVFFAMGRGVPSDLVLSDVHQTDVAATVAQLLGIRPPLQSEGRPIRGIGEILIATPEGR